MLVTPLIDELCDMIELADEMQVMLENSDGGIRKKSSKRTLRELFSRFVRNSRKHFIFPYNFSPYFIRELITNFHKIAVLLDRVRLRSTLYYTWLNLSLLTIFN